MEIEQVTPNKPNFGLILALFCGTLIAVLVLAFFFIKFDGKHLTFRHHSSEPHSQLILPANDSALDS